MLKQRSEFFQSLMMLNDLFFLSVAWWLAYVIRFETDFFPEPEPHLFLHYTTGWLIILIVWTLVFYWLDFYRPRRLSGQRRELLDVTQGFQPCAAHFSRSPVFASRHRSFPHRGRSFCFVEL